MAAIFEDIGNFQKDGTCHFCSVQGETLDVSTVSELLQETTMCLACFTKIIPGKGNRNGSATAAASGRGRGKKGRAGSAPPDVPSALLLDGDCEASTTDGIPVNPIK